jgi:phage/plasmid-like protein (TIGR03299 family)
MAHNIGQMFYFGEQPWHKLGKRLAQPANLEEAMAAGGLNWTVSMERLVLMHEHQSEAPQRQAVVRDDVLPGQAGRVLGVVHPNFRVLQNADGAALFDSLFGKGQRVYHTGGYLKKGEVVWLMAKLPESIVLPGEDKLDTYLLFSNSHDGTLPIDIRLTTVRVVCNNTLSIALRKKD